MICFCDMLAFESRISSIAASARITLWSDVDRTMYKQSMYSRIIRTIRKFGHELRIISIHELNRLVLTLLCTMTIVFQKQIWCIYVKMRLSARIRLAVMILSGNHQRKRYNWWRTSTSADSKRALTVKWEPIRSERTFVSKLEAP